MADVPLPPLAELHRLVEAAGGRRLEPSLPIWELSAPWWPFSRRARRFDSVCGEILAAVAALPGPTYLVIDENPQEYDVGGPWSHAADRTWPLPADCPLQELRRELLAQGDWTLYDAFRPVEPAALPDAFRTPLRELADFASAHSIPVLIQSFHDDDPWRIWLEPTSGRRRIAA